MAVGSDRPDARGLAVAQAAGVPVFACPLSDPENRSAWDRALAERIAGFAPDLVVLAGFMKIVGPAVLERFSPRLVNTHPALLPAFPGAHPVRDALAYGVKITGVTVHLVDEGVDTGPVVAQAAVEVRPGDTEDLLHERIKQVERGLLVDAIGALVRGFTVQGRKVRLP